MTATREPIDVVVPGGHRRIVFDGDASSRVELGVSDRPTGVRFRVRSMRVVTMDFCYPAGMGEERTLFAAGAVRCYVGEYSRRLLGFELEIDRSQETQSVAREIMHAIELAFADLKKRSDCRENPGARMNREAVQRSFEFNSPVPPNWMVDALDAARASGRVSSR
jgi:hypothetical protein